jgi:hypothetical protein
LESLESQIILGNCLIRPLIIRVIYKLYTSSIQALYLSSTENQFY